jgi:hypothetical protein
MGRGQYPYGVRAMTIMHPWGSHGSLWVRTCPGQDPYRDLSSQAGTFIGPYVSGAGPVCKDDNGGDGGGRISPAHPGPNLKAPRDNISLEGNPWLWYEVLWEPSRFANKSVTACNNMIVAIFWGLVKLSVSFFGPESILYILVGITCSWNYVWKNVTRRPFIALYLHCSSPKSVLGKLWELGPESIPVRPLLLGFRKNTVNTLSPTDLNRCSLHLWIYVVHC